MVRDKTEEPMAHKEEALKAELELLHNLLEETRRELERRYSDLEAISRIVGVIHSALDMEELTRVVKEIMENVIKMKAYSLMVFGIEKRGFLFQAGRNLSDTTINRIIHKMDDFISEWTIRPSQAESVTRLGSVEEENLALLCIPLHAQETMVGSLCATSEAIDKFSKEDLNVLSIITAQIAIAIESKKLYDLTKELSITDEVTGVYNYKHFQRRLTIELERSKRFARPLSLIIMGIDKFDSYLESFGKEKADGALKDIGTVLKNHCRKVDTIARYGQSEFALILPETDESGTLVVAEKLRKAIAEYLFWGDEERDQKLTVSLGAVCYPQHLVDPAEIVLKAKEALTQAQKMGTNRIILTKRETLKMQT